MRLHQLTIDSLAQLATALDEVAAGDTDLILALPTGAAIVLGEPEDLTKTALAVGGICVAASAIPLASPVLAEQLRRAIAEGVGSPVLRCQCFPHALFGPAAQLRSLLAELPEGGSDADRLTAALLANRKDLVLDVVSFFFHLLDGTGTDVAIVAGRAHVGGERPVVLIDPAPDRKALAAAETELADRGAGDLARLLRYDGAASSAEELTAVAPEVRVTNLWSRSFCGTVIRAAEVAGLWDGSTESGTQEEAVSLLDLFPGLFLHLEADLANRLVPLLGGWRPLDDMALADATVTRTLAGPHPTEPLVGHQFTGIRGSVRLNDDYAGGALVLLDQRWDDRGVPVGSVALWPAEASYPHQVQPVTQGVKYTLSLWLREAATDPSERQQAAVES